MQDLTTGEMTPLNPVLMKLVEDCSDKVEREKALQRAKDEAIPQRDRQGPVFTVGETLDIRGGKFRVHAITDKRLYLDSIPSK